MTRFATACVLSYNRPHFLRQSIETMLSGAEFPLELIVHDDGSDEETTNWLFEVHSAGLISTVILNPKGHNQGQGTALNRMFNMAAGDPILKLDQDLVYRQGWLRRVVEILDMNQEGAGIAPAPPIGLLGLFHYLHEPVDSRKTIVHDWGYFQHHTHICGSCFAMPREAWEAMRPFEEHSAAFAEDWDMQKRVDASGFIVNGLPPEDLVENVGFGVGPSTVVVAENTVAEIKTEPRIFIPAEI